MSREQWVATEPHRCVAIVHGIGEKIRGELLTLVTEPLAAYLDDRLAEHGEHLDVLDVDLDASPWRRDSAGAVLEVGDERLWVREAWWGERFLPPTYTDVLLWGVAAWRLQLDSVLHGLMRSVDAGSAKDSARDEPQYQVPAGPFATRFYDLLVGSAVLLTLLVLGPFVIPLAVLAWVFAGVASAVLPAARGLASALERTFTQTLGDAYLYASSHIARASQRRAVEEVLSVSLTPAHRATCGGLTIISHSWGTVVALDALRSLSSRTDLDPGQVTFVTLGAALNRLWKLQRNDPIWRDLAALRPWRGRLRWVNIYARYDPVSAGPLHQSLRKYLGEIGLRVIECPVINTDNPIDDHFTYWSNEPEVQARLAHEVLGRTGAWGMSQAERLARTATRRRAVRQLAFARLAAIGAACAIAALVPQPDVGPLLDWVPNLLGCIVLTMLLALLPRRDRVVVALGAVGLFAGWSGLALFAALVGGRPVEGNPGDGLPPLITAQHLFHAAPGYVRVGIDLLFVLGVYKIAYAFWFRRRLWEPIALRLARRASDELRPTTARSAHPTVISVPE